MKLDLKDILLLILAFFLIRNEVCNKGSNPVPAKADTAITVYNRYVDSSIHTYPETVKTIPYIVTTKEPQYIPSQDIAILTKQFNEMRDAFLETKIKKDSAKVDTIGMVYITDTLQKNDVVGRSLRYNLKIPEKTTVINNPPRLRNQWLLGATLQGNISKPINQIGLEMILINKKNKGFKVGAAIDDKGNVNYQGGYLIKL